MVAGEYGSFLRRQLAGIRLTPRAARLHRRFGQSGGHESNGGLVSRQGAGTGRRRVQHRSLGGFHVGPSLVAWAILAYNWRVAFVITGSLGLVWVVLWLLLYQSPDRHRALSKQEKAYISSGQEKHLQSDGSRPSLLKILGQRNFWGIALPRFLADPTWGTLSFWLPLYLSSVRHMDLKQIAMFAWMPFLAADFGCVFGGLVAMSFRNNSASP